MKVKTILILLIIRGGVIMQAADAETLEFYVSPQGRADNSGTLEKPFSSILQARDAIRRLKASGRGGQPVTVFVRGGEYFLNEPLIFTGEDSGTKNAPVVYRAYRDEKPVLAGGLKVSGWTPHDKNVFKADLSATPLGDRAFRLLIFNGSRQQLARYPNHNPEDLNGGNWAYVDGKRYDMYSDSPDEDDYHKTHQHLDFWQRNIPRLTRTLKVRGDDVHSWKNPEQGEISIFPRFNWWHYVLKIESFDPNENVFHLAPGCFYEIRPGDRYYIRGLREELDTPGEWYYDRSESMLYFWPPEPISDKPVYVSLLDNLIRMEGCAHLTIQGFTIECCEKTAVQLRDCLDCVIAANTIRNAGDAYLPEPHADDSYFEGSAVTIRGGSGNRISGNDIYDIGSYGILLSGGDPVSLTRAGNTAENNVIRRVGVVDRKAKGIELTGCGNRVRHNLIEHIPQSAVYAWGNMHLIEYNRIRHTCLEGEDTGAIGGGSIDWLGWQGMVIRYNIIQDTMGYGYDTKTGRWESPHFTWAVYPDWAASGVQIVGNIIVRAPLGLIHMHSGRDNLIENNILVDGHENQVYLSGWTVNTGFWSTMVDGWIKKYEAAVQHPAWQSVKSFKDPRKVPLPDGKVMMDNVFRKNILYYHAPSASLWKCPNLPLGRHESDYNLIYHFGHPLFTGHYEIKSETGPNLLEDSGFEATPPGRLPEAWGPVYPPEGFTAAVDEGQSHSGTRALKITAPETDEKQKAPKIMYMNLGTLAFEPAGSYRFSAWLRGDADGASVEIQAYAWKKDTHYWAHSNVVKLTADWTRHELLFRLPDVDEPAYSPTMKEFSVRVNVSGGAGTIRIDDIFMRKAELMNEWQSWKAAGLDEHSLVADPLFVNPAADDYRLKPDSPAFKLGFEPIPVEKIGPYQDPLRASWPVNNKPISTPRGQKN